MQAEPSAHSASWTNWLLPLAVFVLLAGITITWLRQQQQHDLAEWQQFLNRDSAAHTLEIAERLKLHGNFLRTLGAFADISRPTPRTWQRLTDDLDTVRNLPGLVAIAFAPAILGNERERLVREMRNVEGVRDFMIHPPPQGDLSLPLVFVFPREGGLSAAVGFDLLSENVRREAVENAIASSDVSLSGRVTLRFDGGIPRPGFLLLQAIYRPGAPTSTVTERRRAFAGIVVAAYRLDQLVESLKGSFQDRFRLLITDRGSQFRGLLDPQSEIVYDSSPASSINYAQAMSHEIDFGNRTWQLDFLPQQNLPDSFTFNAQILAGGLLISLLISLLVYHLATRRQRALYYISELDQELRHSEERFRLAVAGTNDGLWDQNLLTGEDYTSPRLAEIFGYTSATAPNGSAHFLRHIHPDDELLRQAAVRKHFAEHTPYDVELRITRADGQPAWIRLRGEGLKDAQGRPCRIAGSVSDISARKLAEDALGELRHLLAIILSTLPLPVFVLDGDRRPLMANTAACRLLSKDESALRQESWPELLAHTPEDERRRLRHTCQRLFDEGGGEAIEFPLGTSNGSIRHMIAHHAHAIAPQGQALLVTVLSDVTELRQAERELLSHRDHLRELVAARTARLDEALKEARAASAAKSEFLANMSHELRTPMHAILSFAHLGQNRSHEERIRTYFHHVGQSAERLLALINDLLDLSKLEAGAIDLKPVLTVLDELLRRAVAQLEPLWASKGLKVDIVGDSALQAEVDPQRLEQVLLNLLANAIKFSPQGSRITLALALDELPYGRRAGDIGTQAAARIEVCDEGVGIPPGEEERIFDKFVQSSLTRTGAGGTGLGLSICREIVGRHRGRITASNRPGGGACFTLMLPVASNHGNSA